MTKRLKTADPTMVPTPTSDSFVAAANEVKSSGADDPAAIKVAPATSSERFNVYTNVFKQMLLIGTILKAGKIIQNQAFTLVVHLSYIFCPIKKCNLSVQK